MGWKEMRARAKENVRYQAMFEGYSIMNGELRVPPMRAFPDRTAAKPIGGAIAEYSGGDSMQKTAGGRVLAGAVIAGPAGAIVGGLLKKEKGKVYATVTMSDDSVVIIEGKKTDEGKLRQFVAKINDASRWYADHEFDDGSFHTT